MTEPPSSSASSSGPYSEPDSAAYGSALNDVVLSYPGPALRIDTDNRIVALNQAAEGLLAGDRSWWDDLSGWLGAAAGGLSASRSVPVLTAAGMVVIEWMVVPLPEGWCLLLGRDATLERQLRLTLTESRQRYKDLVEVSSDFAWETGPDGRFSFVSPRGALGYAVADLIGHHPSEFTLPEWGDLALPFDTQTPIERVEVWLRSADGSPVSLSASAMPLRGADGDWLGSRGVCSDQTDQVIRTQELARVRNRELLLGHIVNTLSNRLDVTQALRNAAAQTTRALSADGCRIYRSGEAGAEAGMRMEAEFGAPPEDVAPPSPGAPTVDMVVARLATPEPVNELWMEEIGGLQVLAARTRYQQAINGVLCVWRRADEATWDEDDRNLMIGVADRLGIAHAHLAYQERLRRLSERDGLTSLFNRRTFLERLAEQVERTDAGPSALFYIDLDNFKAVNDRHGHQQGDAVLKALGSLLTSGVRPGDLPGRMGGDEFVLWLGRCDEEQAIMVTERLLTGIRELRHLSASPEKPLGLSIGLAIHRSGYNETAKALIDRADGAMYLAKSRGKGGYALAPDPIRLPATDTATGTESSSFETQPQP
ncbi:PAS domain S-box-containing protein/diguanylate cyclase (GGDEF) domain-containing protein [uncultured Gammaproteobacteria bacterium]